MVGGAAMAEPAGGGVGAGRVSVHRWCTPAWGAGVHHLSRLYTCWCTQPTCGEKHCFARIAVAENNMNVSSMALPFQYVEGMSAKDYVAAICNSTGVQLCTVPSNGACFFDSIYALLPTVGKAVHSARSLRLQIVDFFRQCAQNRHSLLGERIMTDVAAAMELKIISSSKVTRAHNKKPKNADAYFDAVSLSSVWVDGNVCWRSHVYTTRIAHPLARIPLAKSRRSPFQGASCCLDPSMGPRVRVR